MSSYSDSVAVRHRGTQTEFIQMYLTQRSTSKPEVDFKGHPGQSPKTMKKNYRFKMFCFFGKDFLNFSY